jgi:ATP-dependent DNA ligase
MMPRRRHESRRWVFSEALVEEGAVVFEKACELGLEGIVSKRAGSLYKSVPGCSVPSDRPRLPTIANRLK